MRKKGSYAVSRNPCLLNLTIFVNMSTENLEYKNSMDRLESILERIDNSEMGIDELSERVKEATELLKKCRQILLKTEQNVQEALDSLDEEPVKEQG